jgi:polar amino acid transport system substrate-binding protein
MKKRRTIFTALSFGLLLAVAQFAGTIAEAQQAPDPRVSDLVQAGRLRVAIGLGPAVSAIKDPATGNVRGPALDLARALAARIGIELQPIEYQRPGAVLEGVRTNTWDVTFLVIDPVRAAEVDFSPSYMESDFTYLVPAGSSIRNVADADQPGVRIVVPRGDAVDLRLSRILKQAVLVRADSQTAGVNLLRTGQTGAYAAPRATLLALAAQLPGSHVLEDGFATISFAAFVPKGNAGRLAYVSEFIEEAKASGLVKQIIERAGLRGVKVAPPAKPN